jgi:hypothetical protein
MQRLGALVVLIWQGQVSRQPVPLAGMDALDRSRALTAWLPGTGSATTLLHGGRCPLHSPPRRPQPAKAKSRQSRWTAQFSDLVIHRAQEHA